MFSNAIVLLSLVCIFTTNAEIIRRSEYLDNNDKFHVEWEADLDSKLVTFTLRVRTSGYVGFGIAPGPNMAGADIVIGGVHLNGSHYFSDYYATENGRPEVDKIQSWNLVEALEDPVVGTTLKFTRLLNTCDDQDVAITEDTQYLIWAIGDTDVISYHGNDVDARGPKAVNLLDPPSPPVDVSKFDKWIIGRTMEMPAYHTTYWCSIHRMPDFNGTKRHVVGFNTILDTEPAVKHTHHLLLQKCVPPPGSTAEEYFEKFVGQPGQECFSKEHYELLNLCASSVLYLWGVGGQLLLLPEVAGYPVGEEEGAEYVMMEVHYNNPEQEAGVQVKTELEIYHTPELREHDASVFFISHSISFLQTLPPRTPNFVTIAHCDSACTELYLSPEGVKIFNAMLHSHTTGRKIRVRHFRDNQELPWLANDDHYHFDYQANRPLKEEVSFLPGDHLTIECTYDTEDRDRITIGGMPSSDEMCQAYFWHYPSQLRACESNPHAKLMTSLFGIDEYEWSDALGADAPMILKPDDLAGKSYIEALNEMEWDQGLVESLQRVSVDSDHVAYCDSGTSGYLVISNHSTYPKLDFEYVPEDECTLDSTNVPG